MKINPNYHWKNMKAKYERQVEGLPTDVARAILTVYRSANTGQNAMATGTSYTATYNMPCERNFTEAMEFLGNPLYAGYDKTPEQAANWIIWTAFCDQHGGCPDSDWSDFMA